jgi:Asp-tRNA(Asn)/Glu-tRNA(Gln) amidotransferase A subunit family amidase
MDAPTATATGYDPRTVRLLTFHDAVEGFRAGADTPSAYLERCLAAVAAREPELKAFAAFMPDGARASAEAATARYKAGAALSPIDGMPVAVKDIFETRDAPTGWGTEAFGDNAWRDAAVVRALRVGGAVLVGKTRLPELGFGKPAPTANPWAPTRSPGGSSSGSAAAVGAAMVPCAIGTQGRGSLTRPASYCGVYGYKPTHGAIHRGGDGGGQETNTHIGTLAGALADAWITARYLSEEAGPHPGSFGLEGPMTVPPAIKPQRLVRLEGPGRRQTGEPVKTAYERLLEGIARAGVPVIAAKDLSGSAALETMLADAGAALADIADYESRWPLVMYLVRAREEGRTAFSPTAFERGLRRAGIGRDSYHAALRFRAAYRKALAACADEGLAFVSPAATDTAPDTGSTGSSIYQLASSLAGNPVVSLPLMAVGGLPLSLQLQGFSGADAMLIAHARWLDEAFRAERF